MRLGIYVPFRLLTAAMLGAVTIALRERQEPK